MTRYHTSQSPKVEGARSENLNVRAIRMHTQTRTRHHTADTPHGVYTIERTRLARSKGMRGVGESMGWVGEWSFISTAATTSTATAPGSEAAIFRLQCSCEGKTRAVSRARVGGGLEGAGAPVQRHCPGPNPSHTQGRSQVPAAEIDVEKCVCVGLCVAVTSMRITCMFPPTPLPARIHRPAGIHNTLN